MEDLDFIIQSKDKIKSLESEIEEYKKVISNLQEEKKELEIENEDLRYEISVYKKKVKSLDQKSKEALEAVSRRLEEDKRYISQGNKVTEAYNRMIDVLSDHSSWVHKYHVSRDDFREFYDRLIEASKIINED